MKSVNKVFLLGHVGMIEPRTLTDGTVVANFTVATNSRWKDKDGVPQESVEWHRCEAWNKLGELAGQLLKKGSAIHLEGRLKTKKWVDDGGVEHHTTSVSVDEFTALDGRQEAAVVSARAAPGSGRTRGVAASR
jgi:single-strand DNA-binding protein